MPTGLLGRTVEYGKTKVSTDASGNGSIAVTFVESFVDAPAVLVIPHRADSGSRSATSISKSGFTLTITTSDLKSQDIEVVYVAHEKL